MALAPRRPKLGLALGSGSARGWAHLGVLRALQEEGIVPDVVCGTSIGALVGAAYATGQLEHFSQWAQRLDRRKVFQFMDFQWGGGMIKGEKLVAFLRRHCPDCQVQATDIPFAAVATDLHSGAEVWLRHGLVADAVRASIALPGLFTPVVRDGRLLVDGGLVNPVPVSLARAMGADIVLAVDLNADILRRHLQPLGAAPGALAGAYGGAANRAGANALAASAALEMSPAAPAAEPVAEGSTRRSWFSSWLGSNGANHAGAATTAAGAGAALVQPSLMDVLMTSVNIMQMRITRSRLAGDPPELTIAPHLAHMGLLDFHRAQEAMDAGYQATLQALPELANYGWRAS